MFTEKNDENKNEKSFKRAKIDFRLKKVTLKENKQHEINEENLCESIVVKNNDVASLSGVSR